MKVRPSVKKMCEKCKIIKRKGKVMVICETRSTSSARAEALKYLWRCNKHGSYCWY